MKVLRLFLIFILSPVFVWSSVPAQSSDKVVKVTSEQPGYKVKRGSPFQVGLVIDIDEGYHINSNTPTEDFLIATALKLEPLSGMRMSAVRYPKGKMHKFSFSESPLSVYEGRAVLRFTARALAPLSPGAHNIRGKLTVQACNDELCLRPKTVDIAIPVEVE